MELLNFTLKIWWQMLLFTVGISRQYTLTRFFWICSVQGTHLRTSLFHDLFKPLRSSFFFHLLSEIRLDSMCQHDGPARFCCLLLPLFLQDLRPVPFWVGSDDEEKKANENLTNHQT